MEKQSIVEDSGEQKPEYRVLEIGPGLNRQSRGPLVNIENFVESDRINGKNVKYTAVDVESLFAEGAQRALGEKGSAVQADIEAGVPFKDGAFDLVYMRNVLGDPGDEDMFKLAMSEGLLPVRKRIHDLNRILKPGGEIVVVEEISPPDVHGIAQRLQEAGFEISLHIRTEDPDATGQIAKAFVSDEDAKRLGRRTSSLLGNEDFVLIAKKPN